MQFEYSERVVDPVQGITQGELARYYVAVAGSMLPHVADRPLSLVRPVGVTGRRRLAKRADDLAHEAIDLVEVVEDEGVVRHATIHDERGLVALVEAFALQIQASPARTSDLGHPDRLVFELVPGEGVPFSAVAEAARLVRALFQGLDLESFVMTRGHRGLDVVVPIKPELDWETVGRFAETVAEGLVAAAPSRYGAEIEAEPSQRIRIGSVVEPGETFVAPYSTQLLSNAPVALPAFWYELEQLDPDTFTPAEVVERVHTLPSDPWARMDGLEQRLTLARRSSLANALHRALGG